MLADLKASWARSVLVIVSIAIGVTAVGTMLTTGDVLKRSVEDSFDTANASSAVLFSEPFGADVVDAVEALPEVAGA